MKVDHAIAYALSIFEIKETTRVENTVKTKDMARTTNSVRGDSVNLVDAALVSEDGRTVVHAMDPLLVDSTGADGATVTFYSGVLIFESEENRVITGVVESTDPSENGNTTNLANTFVALSLKRGVVRTIATYKN